MLSKYKVDEYNQEKTSLMAERIKRENLYMEFVKSQEQGFFEFMDYVYTTVDNLKQKAKISPFIEIRARIKDIQSAFSNFEKNKMLDDIFGIEIICANEYEISVIKTELEKALRSPKSRSKFYNKPNGYKAWHESYSAKTETISQSKEWDLLSFNVPAVECQFKTIAVELNPEASHYDYKMVNKEEVQRKLEEQSLIIGKQIPRMWVSRENGFHELEYKEIIQKVYPFVDITTIKEPEDKEQDKEK